MARTAGTVEFVYDFVSTPCHIAWKSLDSMIRAIGAEVVMKIGRASCRERV